MYGQNQETRPLQIINATDLMPASYSHIGDGYDSSGVEDCCAECLRRPGCTFAAMQTDDYGRLVQKGLPAGGWLVRKGRSEPFFIGPGSRGFYLPKHEEKGRRHCWPV